MRKFEYVDRVLSTGYEMKEPCFDLPKRATKYSAGYDFFNPERVTIEPNEIKYIKTGVKVKMQDDEVLLLYNRSSNPKKKGIQTANGVGVIDSDYYNNSDNEGEIAFEFENRIDKPVTIEVGEKLGQGIFTKFLLTEDDNITKERKGGFGSTGK